MINVNGFEFDWTDGMTMQSVVDLAARDPRVVIAFSAQMLYILNKLPIDDGQLAKTPVEDGDSISLLSLLGGG